MNLKPPEFESEKFSRPLDLNCSKKRGMWDNTYANVRRWLSGPRNATLSLPSTPLHSIPKTKSKGILRSCFKVEFLCNRFFFNFIEI